jgi:hypothetical protein
MRAIQVFTLHRKFINKPITLLLPSRIRISFIYITSFDIGRLSKKPVLQICIVFDADPEPDPTFRFGADPDPDPDPTQVYTSWNIGNFVLTFIPSSARWFITSNISNCKTGIFCKTYFWLKMIRIRQN